MIDEVKYPKVARFLRETGMSLDEAYEWVEKEIERLKEKK